jgi:hypothetical protein
MVPLKFDFTYRICSAKPFGFPAEIEENYLLSYSASVKWKRQQQVNPEQSSEGLPPLVY